jgi:predicted O-methyltransferase YrrM
MVNFDEIDRGLAFGEIKFNQGLATEYGANVLSHPEAGAMAETKALSMLGTETLLMLRAFAMEAQGAIMEVGPYVGGSTIAILKGVAASSPKPIASIDPGGKYLEHPSMPSEDIHADWLQNITNAGFAGKAYLAKGFGNVDTVCADAIQSLGGQMIGMLFIDANGDIWKNMEFLLPYLTDDCLIILDDYTNLTAPDDIDQNVKFGPTQRSVDAGVDAGALIHYGTFMWGTWFGRRGPNLSAAFPELVANEKLVNP